MNNKTKRPVLLVVGSGHAGFDAARKLERLLRKDEATILLVSDVDHLNYLSLLPGVSAGVLDPRSNAVALHRALRRTRIMLGEVTAVDLDGRTATVRHPSGTVRSYAWDKLLLTPGGVPRTVATPGLEAHGLPFRTLPQAVFLRDHVLHQLEIADAIEDSQERAARCTFVTVGAGYSGTEFIGQMQLAVNRALPRFTTLHRSMMRWLLLDAAPAILPELDPRLGQHATKRLTERGVDVRVKTTIENAAEDGVQLSDGELVPTRTVVWTAGVTPPPLVAALGLPTDRGRLVVAPDLQVPGHPDVFAAGDTAAVPDLARPGQLCGATAQHATRQGKRAAANIVASLRKRSLRDYRHHDLGFLVDLGGRDAAATPLGIPLSGVPAKLVTLGYHLYAIPTGSNRMRVAADWMLNWVTANPAVRLGYVADEAAQVATTASAQS